MNDRPNYRIVTVVVYCIADEIHKKKSIFNTLKTEPFINKINLFDRDKNFFLTTTLLHHKNWLTTTVYSSV